MNNLLLIVIGALLGGAIGWLLSRGRAISAEAVANTLRGQQDITTKEIEGLRERLEAEQKSKASAEAFLQAERQHLEEQRRTFEGAKTELVNTFKSLSGDVLGAQSESFLQLAKESLNALLAESKGDLSARQEAIAGLIHPLKEAVERYESEIKQIESSRQEAYGALREHLTHLGETQSQLQRETANLVTALRKPQVRGRWGEITLRRLAELAGMVDRCDFIEQPTVTSEDRHLRPDMIVHLPADRVVVVDSKVALDAYIDATESSSPEEKEHHLARHAGQVRRHMEDLASKAYQESVPKTADFVVLFLPGDPFLGAAVERDPTLIEDGMSRNVVISTPSTLIALLLAVSHGWRLQELNKNIELIGELGKQLYKRVGTMWGHLDSLRAAIDKSVEAWNRVVGSLEYQILPSVRRFRDLKATTAEEIPQLEPVERTTRALPPSPGADSE